MYKAKKLKGGETLRGTRLDPTGSLVPRGQGESQDKQGEKVNAGPPAPECNICLCGGWGKGSECRTHAEDSEAPSSGKCKLK